MIGIEHLIGFVRIARAVGSKTSTTTAPAHHPNANSFVSVSRPRMLDPFPLVSLVPRAPSRLDLEAAQTLGLPKSTADTTSARCTEKATDRRCAHRAQPLASRASVWTPTLFGLPLTVHRFDYLPLSILTYHFCVRLPLTSPFDLDPFVFRYRYVPLTPDQPRPRVALRIPGSFSFENVSGGATGVRVPTIRSMPSACPGVCGGACSCDEGTDEKLGQPPSIYKRWIYIHFVSQLRSRVVLESESFGLCLFFSLPFFPSFISVWLQ